MNTELYKERIIKIIMDSKFLRNFAQKTDYLKPINWIDPKENWRNKEILENPNSKDKEPLVALNSYNEKTKELIQLHKKIFPVPAYFNQNIKNAMPILYSREGVVDYLLRIIDELPDEYGIIVYDGYRPVSVQQSLFDTIYELQKSKPENKNCTHEELEKLTNEFASTPSLDPKKPSTHTTGGAIDFSICDLDGKELNFGCDFDDFHHISNVTYFEEKYKNGENLTDAELEAMLNRRVLSNIGSKVGFSLNEFEWWHMDIYNQWDDGMATAMYGSCEINGVIPNPNNTIAKYIQMNKNLQNHFKYLTPQALELLKDENDIEIN